MRSTPHALAVKLAYRDRLLRHFGELAKQRPKRDDVVVTDAGPEMGWALFERREMLAEVNLIRESLGYVPTTIGAVRSADLLSCGHVDYAEKFALYCAEIAIRKLP